MIGLSGGVREVVAMLTAAGVHAVADPADLGDLPAVIVYPSTVDLDRLGGDVFDLALDVVLVAGGVPALAALDQLDALLEQIRPVLGGTAWRALSVNLPNLAGDPLPALTSTVTVQVTRDEQENTP